MRGRHGEPTSCIYFYLLSHSPSYELVGVVSHHGTLSSGHYTAFCRSHSDPTWRLYDDLQVTQTSLQQVLAETDAYLLVYSATTS